ncbi:hypothetical protein AnigIFM49718_010234 [Aspergillus niger]|nr:hypothetical protein AnigIFM49718_010234 [Aspergillus niger]
MLKSKTPYFGLRGGWLTFWITLACGADMTLYGYDQGVFSGVVISQDFLQLHNLEGPSKTSLLGTVTAIYDVGCFLGSICAYWLGERLGRRKTVLVGTTVMAIGAVLQASSYSVGQMMTGRVIAGIGNGLNTSTAPIWQVETSNVHWRGKLVILENVLVLVGFSLANWLNYGLSFASGPVSWRFPLSFQFIFIIVLALTVPWLPESPRWLIAHGQEETAVQIIADLENKATNDPFVQFQTSEIQYSVKYERENSVNFSDILRGRAHERSGTKTIRRLILGMGAQAMQQFSGINVSSYYLPTVLTKSVGMMYPTEINSLTMRTKGAALGAATNWIFNFMVVEITPIGIQNLGWRFYMIWIVLNAAMVPVIYVFYPETAGRTLEDMDEYYRGNPPLFVCFDREAISRQRPERYQARDEHVIRAKEGDVIELAQHVENATAVTA